MLSDSYIDDDGNEIIDACYDRNCKGANRECIRMMLARCAACGEEIEKGAQRHKLRLNWTGQTNHVYLRMYVHIDCKRRMAKKLFKAMILPLRKTTN